MTHTTSAPLQRPRWIVFAAWCAVAIFAAVGAANLRAAWPGLVRRAAGGRLHLPNASLFASQPVAMQLHILALSLALPLGVVMMASRKGRTFHRAAGWTWTGLVLIGAATPVWLALDGGGWRPIHLLVVWVLTLLAGGLWSARRHRPQAHGALMMWLFYGSIVFAGALTFAPGRLMWRLFFG
jgi:uncharacterized membrane protein